MHRVDCWRDEVNMGKGIWLHMFKHAHRYQGAVAPLSNVLRIDESLIRILGCVPRYGWNFLDLLTPLLPLWFPSPYSASPLVTKQSLKIIIPRNLSLKLRLSFALVFPHFSRRMPWDSLSLSSVLTYAIPAHFVFNSESPDFVHLKIIQLGATTWVAIQNP